MLRKVSSFFYAVSKEMHVSLLNVKNVKEKEKTKALAAAKEVPENTRRAKLLENYSRSSQLRKQRRLEESQNAREIDPRTAAIDDITLDMIDEEPQRVKRNQYARPKNWDTIAEHYGQWGKKNTVRASPNVFADRTSRSFDQALRQWSKDFNSKVPSKAYSPHRAPAYGNIIGLLLLANASNIYNISEESRYSRRYANM